MSGDLIKITAVVIIAAVMVIVLRSRLQEYAFLLVLAVVCVAVIAVLSNIFPQVEKLRAMFENSGNGDAYFSVALKALGITYITSFAANVCRDFGLGALAQITESCGKGAVFILSIPLVCAVLEVALKFVGL